MRIRASGSSILPLIGFACIHVFSEMGPAQTDWPVFGHDAGAQKYSPLTQITRQNVAQLKLAWEYRTTDAVAPRVQDGRGRGGMRRRVSEISPLVIGNVMYVATPYNYVVALEPEAGQQIWRWEYKDYGPAALRGLSYWAGDNQSPATIFSEPKADI